MDPQVFHIQALLLVKAVTVFNASAQAPVVVDFLSDGFQAYIMESTNRGVPGSWGSWVQ